MGVPGVFLKEKLVIGVLTSRKKKLDRLHKRLEIEFGPIDYRSDPLLFTFSRYYDGEMGTPISRIFFSFERLFPPDLLAGIKLATNRIEDEYRETGYRKINLDPGFLSLGRFVLATTKDGAHRIPLHSGIYAELTLVYEKKGFRSLKWTYPDYRSPEYNAILANIRSLYKAQIQNQGRLRDR